MTSELNDDTTRYVFPIEMVIGIAPRQGLVSLSLRWTPKFGQEAKRESRS